MADRFPLILNTSANQIQEIASGDTLDLTGSNIKGVGIITATNLSGNIIAGAGTSNIVSGIGTFTDLRVGGDTSFSEDLVVTGNARITGILTVGTSSIILNDSANTIKVGTALTLGHTQGVQFHTQNLHSEGFEVNQINASGIATFNEARFGNSKRLKFGDDIDLQIYHFPAGSGNNYISAANNTGIVVSSQNVSLMNQNHSAYFFKGEAAGSIVYHNNTARVTTTSTGINITGNSDVSGNLTVNGTNTILNTTTYVQGGEGADGILAIYADEGDDNNDKWRLRAGANAAFYIDNYANGAWQTNLAATATSTQLYSAGYTKVNTTTNGINVYNGESGGTTTINVTKGSGDAEVVCQRTGGSGIKLRGSHPSSFLETTTDSDLNIRRNTSTRIVLGSSGNTIAGDTTFQSGITGTTASFSGNVSVGGVLTYEDVTNVDSVGIVTARGGVVIPDNKQLKFGGSTDFKIEHNSNENYIDSNSGHIYIRANVNDDEGDNIYIQPKSGENSAVFIHDGAVELYHNGTKRLETFDNNPYVGVSVTNDLILNGAGDTAIRWAVGGNAGSNYKWGMYYANVDGALRIFDNVNSRVVAVWKNTGAIELNYAASKKFETTSDGTKFSGSALFPDNQRIKVGGDASTPDLQIWHDGSHTRVSHTGTGQLVISGNDNDQVKLMKGTSEEGIILNNNGNVELYHNNDKRFATTDYGATIDGRLRCYALPQSTSATTPIALTLSSYTNATEEGPYMVFNSKWMNGYDNWVVGAIAGIYETQSPGGNNAGALVFRTNYNNNGAQGLGGTTEKMRIRGDGQVRIRHSADQPEIEHACLRVIKTGSSYTDKTMLSLENGDGTLGDLDYQTSHIDFSFFDTNTNVYPQVRISAHLGDGSNADSQVKEGKGWLSFHCSNTGAISGQANPQEHFRIKHNGDLLGTDTSIGSLCDSRLKKDITDYSYSLDVFKQFKPKTFNWINPDLHGKHANQRGFIAQEVESIDSYFTDQAIVDEKIDDYNLVTDGLAKTTKLVEKDAMYISVIQQMIDKIEKLETEVAALKGS